MKITKEYLKQVIKEEVAKEAQMNEARPSYLGDVFEMLKSMDPKTAEASLVLFAKLVGRSDKELAQLFSKAIQVSQRQPAQVPAAPMVPPAMEESEEVEEGIMGGLKGAFSGLKKNYDVGSVKSDLETQTKKAQQSMDMTIKLLGGVSARLEKLGMNDEAGNLASSMKAMQWAKSQLSSVDAPEEVSPEPEAPVTSPPPPPVAAAPSKVRANPSLVNQKSTPASSPAPAKKPEIINKPKSNLGKKIAKKAGK